MSEAPRAMGWAGPLRAVLPAVAVGFATAGGTRFAAWGQPLARPIDWLAVVLVLAGPAALLVRRRWPIAVLVTAMLAAAAYLALGYPYGPIFLPAIVALCSAVLAGHRKPAYVATAVGVVTLAGLHMLRNPGTLPLTGMAAWLAGLAAVIAICEGLRARRERAVQVAAARAEAERRQVSDERLRIAQELHDVLGHHVSLINVQAGVALYLMDDDPEQARTALTAIKQSSRDLLREMRATLGVLRGVDAEAPHHPVPGLADLDALVADVRAAGLPVEVTTEGTAAELPPAVARAAYRIVQEALTNTRRHAGPASASVLLRYTADGLTVQVDDDGTSGPATDDQGGGNGITGMRERARSLGGTSSIGPLPGGGFRVRAYLPVHGDQEGES